MAALSQPVETIVEDCKKKAVAAINADCRSEFVTIVIAIIR